MNRLEALLQYYEADPNDPFNVYALAIEYLKTDVQRSRQLFDVLLEQHPLYVPTYYHAAKMYQELNEKDRAIATYEKGIAVALACKDMKAHRELQSAYAEMMFD